MSISAAISSERSSFSDCLSLLEKMDKLCSQQKLPANFDTLSESAKSKIKERIEKSKKEADDKEKELFSKFDASSKEYALLVEILKNIKIRNGLGKPEEFEPVFSRYGQHFNQEVYREILPYCQLAYLYERNGVAAEHAEKLSVLFDSVKDILDYLRIQSKQNKKDPFENLVHDACLFQLPELNKISEESWKKWKSLVKSDKGNTAFIMDILPNAKIIEDLVVSNYSSAKKPEEVATATVGLISKIGELNQKVKNLSSGAAGLGEEEKKMLETARQKLSDLKIALFEECKGLSLKNLNIIYLVAFNQKVLINLGSFAYLVAKIGEQNYQRFKKLKRQYEGTNDAEIPNIKIDGKDLTPSFEGFYLMKVPVQDELQAARAACLGKLTNCCQSLSGEAGDPCVVHGLTSQYGGFYVICKGDPNNPTVEDYLLGQCWAWRSKSVAVGKSGAVVFDSIEVANKNDEFNRECVINFFEKLARIMIEEKLTDKVVCGSTSGISKHVGFDAFLNRAEVFNEGDYCRYSDSRFQRVLQDRNAPFYFFSTDEACKQKTIELAEEAMKTDSPLIESDYMIQLLNYIALEISNRTKPRDYSDENDRLQNETFLKSALDLREAILNCSKQFKKEDKVLDILSGIEQYLELTDESIDSIFEKIKNKTFSTKTVNKDKESILLALLEKEPMTDSIKAKIYDLIDNSDVDINLPDIDGITPFMRAAQLKDLDLCKKLKEKGADVNAVDRDYEGFLFVAYDFFTDNESKNIEEEEMDFLLKLIKEFGIDINSRDRNDETLLMKLAKIGNVSFLEKLINNGACTDTRDYYGETALMHALRYRKKEACLFLIDKDNSLINIGDNNGYTPLMQAMVFFSDEDISKVLIEKGADVNAKDWSGVTPLMFAAQRGFPDVYTALIKKGALTNIKDASGQTALMHALRYRTKEACLFLIDKDNSLINISDNKGRTPLMEAMVCFSDEDISKLLIEKGADVNAKDWSGVTPLMFAAERSFAHVCMELIKKGADVNAMDRWGVVPLMLSLKRGLSDVCMALIEAGAYIDDDIFRKIENHKDEAFKSAIKNSIEQKTIKRAEEAMRTDSPLIESDYIIQLLNQITLEISDRSKTKDYSSENDRLENKAFLKSALGLREAILNCSKKFNKEDEVLDILSGIEQYLELTDENIDSIFEKIKNKTFSTKTTNKGRESILLALLKKEPVTDSIKSKIYYLIDNTDVDVNVPDIDGLTPFMRAAQLKDFALCTKLKEKGAAVNALDKRHQSVLFVAYNLFNSLRYNGARTIEEEEMDFLLKLIVEFEVNINAVDSDNETLLIKLSRIGNISYLKKLIDNGALTNIKDCDGQTALMHALRDRKKEAFLFLVNKNRSLINIADNKGRTPLSEAILWGDDDIFKVLIEKGADVNAKDVSGETLLMLAIRVDKIDFCKTLITKGVDVNSNDNDFSATPLILAALRGSSDICINLIKNGADVNAKDRYDQTALMFAAERGLSDVCSALISAGAEVNAKSNSDATPLKMALMGLEDNLRVPQKGLRDVCIALIEAGANIDDDILRKIENHRDEAFKSDIKDSIARREEIKRKEPLSFRQKENIPSENEPSNLQSPKPGSK